MFWRQFGVSQTSAEYGLRRTSRIFSSNKKVCQRIGRKDSLQAACRRMRRLEEILYLAAQNFKLFSKNQKSKFDHLYRWQKIGTISDCLHLKTSLLWLINRTPHGYNQKNTNDCHLSMCYLFFDEFWENSSTSACKLVCYWRFCFTLIRSSPMFTYCELFLRLRCMAAKSYDCTYSIVNFSQNNYR